MVCSVGKLQKLTFSWASSNSKSYLCPGYHCTTTGSTAGSSQPSNSMQRCGCGRCECCHSSAWIFFMHLRGHKNRQSMARVLHQSVSTKIVQLFFHCIQFLQKQWVERGEKAWNCWHCCWHLIAVSRSCCWLPQCLWLNLDLYPETGPQGWLRWLKIWPRGNSRILHV